MDRTKERQEARAYWDKHGIDEGVETGVEEGVEAKKPLSMMISIRLSQEDISKLKALAKIRRSGITTTARKLLEEALERPFSPILFQALEDTDVQRCSAMAAGLADRIWDIEEIVSLLDNPN